MNPVVFQFSNGNVFFVGLVMVVAAHFLRLWCEGRILGLILTVCLIGGIVLVVFSATPFPIWFYCLWFGVCAAAATVFIGKFSFQRKLLVSFPALLCSIAMGLVELPYHLSPTIHASPKQTIVVIGDSISAGISTKERAWPDVLADKSHFKVINLARAGATTGSAFDQSARVTESNCLVFVEIGGNDLLGSTDSKTFSNQLDKLLGKLKERNSQIVMFELPLFPFCNGFGAAQRNLAKKYDAILIPKHFMTNVFALSGGTLDGLHLSQKGHEALANSIRDLIKTN